jgi:hypothetical protein
MQKSPVFDETYHQYLAEILTIDYLSRADMLGVEQRDGTLLIPLYDTTYLLSGKGIAAQDGTPVTPAVNVILSKYVLMCPVDMQPVPDRLMTYREFRDASPLVSYFTKNTNKTIESQFAGRISALEKRALQLGAVVLRNDAYDLSVQFHALPRIPVILNFNDRDDMFPATCSILYKLSAEQFLDMECLAMTGTLLAGKLIKP